MSYYRSTSSVCGSSPTYTRMTLLPVLMSLNWQRSSASWPCYKSISYCGQDSSPEWGFIACPRSHGTANSPLTKPTEGHQRSDTRTVWKKKFLPWSILYEDRDIWCRFIKHAVSFENIRRITPIEKRCRTKNRLTKLSQPWWVSVFSSPIEGCFYCWKRQTHYK